MQVHNDKQHSSNISVVTSEMHSEQDIRSTTGFGFDCIIIESKTPTTDQDGSEKDSGGAARDFSGAKLNFGNKSMTKS